MIPFTYLVKHIPTNRYYYGVRYKKGCHPNDLWKKYFTSSRKVKGLIRRYGKKSFIFEIRKTFKTAKQAYNWEHKVLRRMKVIHRDDFLNLTDHLSVDPKHLSKLNRGKGNPMYGRKLSKERKKELSRLNIGRRLSEETKEKLRFYAGKNHYMYGKKLSEETKEKIRIGNLGKKHTKKMIKYLSKINKGGNNAMYGRKHTKETKEKMRFAWEKRRVA
jgi:hypothetical protein